MSDTNIFKKFPKTFWVANTIELFERWAWYGFFMLFANYLTGSTDQGALGFSQSEKGAILGIGTGILYFLPIITGAIADRFGYKKVLMVSFFIYASAFVLLPQFETFTGVFVMYLYLALGAALFKPVISATIAKTTTNETKSIGFGIFYMMVNLGAFFGPMVTMLFKSKFELVFYISAVVISLNFVMMLLYKEPEREKQEGSLGDAIVGVFKNIGVAISDLKFLVFLLIVAGFWTMYNQLFFTLPVFITQWVDTSHMFNFFQEHMPFFSENYGVKESGQMQSEFIVNFDAMFIIIFQIMISTLVMKWRSLSTMVTGFLVCSIGMALTLLTQNVAFTMAAIFIFAIGEMAGSPKITEYISLIAPKDKIALYMGCSFIPVFLGNIFAGYISGSVYGAMADKVTLLHREVAERGLQISEKLTQNEYFEKAAELMNFSETELTQFLWDKYDPSNIWFVLLSIGLMSALSLFVYDKVLRANSK